MVNYFSINGYWKDDQTQFEGYIVKDNHDCIDGEDESVFYYGLSEEDIKVSIEKGEGDILDFVITSYEKI